MAKIEWECVLNHMPKILIDYESEISALISSEESRETHKKLMALLDRYNNLTYKEENPNTDPFELYGVDDEKQEIIDEIIAIETSYLEAAKELRKIYGNED